MTHFTRILFAFSMAIAFLPVLAIADSTQDVYESPGARTQQTQTKDNVPLPDRASRYARAKKEAETARSDLRRAMGSLKSTKEYVRSELFTASGLGETRKRLSELRQQYDAARKRILSQLKDDPDYRQLQIMNEAVLAAMEKLHGKKDARNQITPYAEMKLHFDNEAAKIEAALMNSNAELIQLKDQLNETLRESHRLQTDINRQAETDPRVATATKSLDAARDHNNNAEANLASSRAAWRQAKTENERINRIRQQIPYGTTNYYRPYYSRYWYVPYPYRLQYYRYLRRR